jgi:trehalose 6-phosphate phosphatase
MATNRTTLRILGLVEEDAWRQVAPLAEDPSRAAILLDVDGTLAPIVARPELASVPEPARAELRRLVARYALVACISGRTGRDAWKLVGVDGITYVGVHGLELAPEADAWRPVLHGFAQLDWPWIEDKSLTVAFHWREAPDEEAARSELAEIAGRADDSGLVARWGRKVLELRPPVVADKGTAVRTLLDEHRLRRALYAGDDTTDLDAFRGLEGCEVSVRVALASAESPPGLREAADLVLGSPKELLELMRLL